LATAQAFIDEGAKVIITGRRQAELDEAVSSLGEYPFGVQGDVSNFKDLNRLYETIKDKYGRVDILFANTGVAKFVSLEETSEELYDYHFNINVKGLFFTVQKALPLLSEGASIILNASIVGYKGFENFSVYSASKAAVRSFARTWATDLKSRKIRVNAISPGPIGTPIYGKVGLTEEQMEELGAGFAQQVPLARFGTPSEIASTAVFLASNDSSYVNGVDLAVDGGLAQI
jgi:NAD(P)-dependent dehydrogenase (short-subunit alcohol dehydrogenase family)